MTMSSAVFLVITLVSVGLLQEHVQGSPVHVQSNSSINETELQKVSKLKDSCSETVFKDCCEVKLQGQLYTDTCLWDVVDNQSIIKLINGPRLNSLFRLPGSYPKHV